MIKTPTPLGEQRTLLNVSWQTFKTLLAEMGENRAARVSYTDGKLEIMTPLMPHENSNRLIEALIVVLAEEMGLEIKRSGSLTCKREDLQRACEPDSSYYIQNEPQVRAKVNIDLDIDPPPDLVLEVEYSRSNLNKFEIYASLGVLEFWRYKNGGLQVYCLQSGQYVECETSPTFSPIPVKEIPRFLTESRQMGEISMTKKFRNWVREQLRQQTQ
ncbi:Uma2 family endonuclease [Phormidium sp. CCY1219]|uniref:Uma2 family endonuclease n=1 Tax=Phormidium sp. CCY1219 TaxID=2886104 RepID=UPI002D1F6DCD|nr:Uma2 family endonuclease [Phormidium sp. CCY1219]MEB3831002.1 Uma2 family endonuclease [Phormidium sp. CCY1219]